MKIEGERVLVTGCSSDDGFAIADSPGEGRQGTGEYRRRSRQVIVIGRALMYAYPNDPLQTHRDFRC
jgi:hypothetical protein